jgi:hypothetical protein
VDWRRRTNRLAGQAAEASHQLILLGSVLVLSIFAGVLSAHLGLPCCWSSSDLGMLAGNLALWSRPKTWSNLTAAVSPSRRQRSSCKRARWSALLWSMSASIPFRGKKTIKFAWEKYHGRKEAEPIDRRDRLGRGGTRRLHALITLPDCIRPLLERRFLKGGDP